MVMAVSRKLLVLSVFLTLIFTSTIRADDASVVESLTESKSGDVASLQLELNRLTSKIQSLESDLDLKNRELKGKNEIIADKEKVIKEKSGSIESLQKEVASLQTKGSLDAEEQVRKAHARAGELEKQVERLQMEIEMKTRLREALEARGNEAEQKMREMSSKLQTLQKSVDEQKLKLRNTERALKVAEEELMKAKHEATSKTKELTEVHGAWLPPWLAAHLLGCQSFLETHWEEHGKPTVRLMIQKAMEKKSQAAKWAEPHMEIIKTKWVPAVKEQWLLATTYAEPHLQSLVEKTTEIFEASKSAATPHVIKMREFCYPHFQGAKKFCKPYINQIATVTKPHVDKVRTLMEPYTKMAIHSYGKFLDSATKYHQQVQVTVEDTLKKHEITRAIATTELVWFFASALLALPILVLFRMLLAITFRKPKKANRNNNSNHVSRKAKRGHHD